VVAALVVYHQEGGIWWAESPDVEGFGASADSLDELRPMVREGIAFYLEDDQLDLDEQFPYPVAFPGQWVGAFVSIGQSVTAGSSVLQRDLVTAVEHKAVEQVAA
jgi:predicted RNase H-like HicB family nuclease